jgi:putative zinc finger/helix-turn-helix YgiT family protein
MEKCHEGVRKVVAEFKTVVQGVKLVLPGIERFYCPVCDETFFDGYQLEAYYLVRDREYAKKTRLTGPDVVRIRRKLGLTQRQLERKLGLGKRVVVRWENSKVRLPGPVNVLLKILNAKPDVLKFGTSTKL